MKNKIINITIFFVILISIIIIKFNNKWNGYSYEEHSRDQIVKLNEIEKLSEKLYEVSNENKDINVDTNKVSEKDLTQEENNTNKEYNTDVENSIDEDNITNQQDITNKDTKEQINMQLKDSIHELQEDLRKDSSGYHINDAKVMLWSIYGLTIIFLFVVFGYTYFQIIHPFVKLNEYAGELAKGNFDVMLKYERTNYFGAFTWAFDHMRREITKARACEKEAIDNNKTVIATLSHDIKTPIASIRAYAEGLDANLDSNVERRRRYISVIMNKCDEVTKLTNDLFLHSLADLDKLKMNLEPTNISEVIAKTVEEMSIDKKDIVIKDDIIDSMVLLDRKRFVQVLENLVNNSRKYASGSKIEISTRLENKEYIISVRDFGNGIPDEDLPFIFEKFYRGKNVQNEQGSGLGLYIVKYIMEQMEGNVTLQNTEKGLDVILNIPIY